MSISIEDNLYEILGVSPDASQEEIERVFKQSLIELQDNSKDSKKKRVLLEKVYYILGDEMRRYEYDYWSRVGNEKSNANNTQSLLNNKPLNPLPYNRSIQRSDNPNINNRPSRKTAQRHGENDSPSVIKIAALFLFVFIIGKAWAANTSSTFPRSNMPAVNTNYSDFDQGKNALELPPSGEIYYYKQVEAIAPFGINTEPDVNYFVKLIDVETNLTAVTIFVHGGQSVETKVPLGTYEFRYACGEYWYGEEELFGAWTVYMKADKKLTFYNDGSRIMGHKIYLIKRIDGNLHSREINKNRF